MSIKRLDSNRIGWTGVDSLESGNGKGGKAAKAAGDRDTVKVSDEAKLRAVARKTASEDDGVRADRVAQLKAQIAAGTYQPDFKKTASNLVRDELDLFV